MMFVIMGQFMEIKISVLKKTPPEVLLGITDRDITERFELFIFFLYIWMNNTINFGEGQAILMLIGNLYIIWSSKYIGSEILVDNLKHFFLVHGHQIDPRIYSGYTKFIARFYNTLDQKQLSFDEDLSDFNSEQPPMFKAELKSEVIPPS